MKEKRAELFNKRRLFNNQDFNVNNALGQIVHNEYSNIMKELQKISNDNETLTTFTTVEEFLQLEYAILAENGKYFTFNNTLFSKNIFFHTQSYVLDFQKSG